MVWVSLYQHSDVICGALRTKWYRGGAVLGTKSLKKIATKVFAATTSKVGIGRPINLTG